MYDKKMNAELAEMFKRTVGNFLFINVSISRFEYIKFLNS
jgi:hypothetical protein